MFEESRHWKNVKLPFILLLFLQLPSGAWSHYLLGGHGDHVEAYL